MFLEKYYFIPHIFISKFIYLCFYELIIITYYMLGSVVGNIAWTLSQTAYNLGEFWSQADI